MAYQLKNAELLLAARSMHDSAHQSMDADLFELCALGLQEIAERFDEYRHYVAVSLPFAEHLVGAVQSVCIELSCENTNRQESAFALMEDMAVIFREVALRKGYENLSPPGQTILHYFESSGHWRANEGTLVADYYYTRIPVAVMQGFMEKVQEMTGYAARKAV